MSYLNPTVISDSVLFDMSECIEQGRKLRAEYISAHPFPHIVRDEFLPACILNRVVDEFPARQRGRFADAHSRNKTGYQLEAIKSVYVANLLAALNSAPFLRFLEQMTSIDGLIPDPYFLGGGLHESVRGGHLSIHADFNVHDKLKLIRRLNLILFLNEHWLEKYGGHLELWSSDMTLREQRILPVFGRVVVFNTDEKSYHGHPDPLNCPETRSRRSIALYYYSSLIDGPDRVRPYTTQFKVRPGSADRYPYRTRVRELLRDFCPPVLWRRFAASTNDRRRRVLADTGTREARAR
jgi:hypothetical protein